MEISSTTKLALDLVLNGYKSGSGKALRGKNHCTDYTFTYDNKKELTIPYDALKLLENAKDLILMANNMINSDKNAGE
jgi:hypothetical protein